MLHTLGRNVSSPVHQVFKGLRWWVSRKDEAVDVGQSLEVPLVVSDLLIVEEAPLAYTRVVPCVMV
jgi:hypothetical protein